MSKQDSTTSGITRRTALQGTALLGLGSVVGTASVKGNPTRSQKRPASRAIAEDVRRETRWAWENYKEHAWGHDMIKPVSGSHEEFFTDDQSVGLTIVEALDTLYLMGFDCELRHAVNWIEENLTFEIDTQVSIFESNIRLVGGLLSGYKATENETLLSLARDLADRLLPAFTKSPTGMPYASVNLKTGKVEGSVNYLAEIGTIIAEFGELSRLVDDERYYQAAKKALRSVYENRSDIDLVGAAIDVETSEWTDSVSRIGPPVDSLYEYLWDGWRLFGDTDLLRWFGVMVDAIQEHQAEWHDGQLWYKQVDMTTGEVVNRHQSELATFWAGLMAEAGQTDLGANYHDSWTEVHEKFDLPPGSIDYTDLSAISTSYWLRPEYLGPALILYNETGEGKYRNRGYHLYDRMKSLCRVDNGYTVITDVTASPMTQGDVTPGYWWSENLKYFYLLFADGHRLEKDYYLSTEGNVLRGI